MIGGALDYDSAGTYAVTVSASDGNLHDAVSFTWTVNDVNRAPGVTNPGAQTSDENTSPSLQIAASDPDGDALTYAASGLPPGLAIDPSSGATKPT